METSDKQGAAHAWPWGRLTSYPRGIAQAPHGRALQVPPPSPLRTPGGKGSSRGPTGRLPSFSCPLSTLTHRTRPGTLRDRPGQTLGLSQGSHVRLLQRCPRIRGQGTSLLSTCGCRLLSTCHLSDAGPALAHRTPTQRDGVNTAGPFSPSSPFAVPLVPSRTEVCKR